MSGTCYLYVIAATPEGPCKIGISSDPDRRLRQLQTGHAAPLAVHHRAPVEAEKARLLERLLHRDIGHLRAHGEWFTLSATDAAAYVAYAIIQYDAVENLGEKVRRRMI